MPATPYDYDDDDDDWLHDDIRWADHDDVDAIAAATARHDDIDFDVDNYPTIDVTGHHYVLIKHFDRPFVIVNNDAPSTAAGPGDDDIRIAGD